MGGGGGKSLEGGEHFSPRHPEKSERLFLAFPDLPSSREGYPLFLKRQRGERAEESLSLFSGCRGGEVLPPFQGFPIPSLQRGSRSPSSAPLSLFTIFSMARVLPTPLRQSYSPGREGGALDGLLDPLWREGVGNPWREGSTSPSGTQRKVKGFS